MYKQIKRIILIKNPKSPSMNRRQQKSVIYQQHKPRINFLRLKYLINNNIIIKFIEVKALQYPNLVINKSNNWY